MVKTKLDQSLERIFLWAGNDFPAVRTVTSENVSSYNNSFQAAARDCLGPVPLPTIRQQTFTLEVPTGSWTTVE